MLVHNEVNDTATIAQTETMLGISRHNLMALISAKVIDARYDKPERRRSDWLVSVASIDALMGRLARATTQSDLPGGRSLGEAVGSPFASSLGGVVGVLERICDDQLPLFSPTADFRFSNLKIDMAVLQALAKPPPSAKLTVLEAAKELGVIYDAFSRLVTRGFIPHTIERRGIRSQRVISREDFERFSSQYVTVGQIVKTIQANPITLTDRLIDAGLTAVSGPKIDGGLVYVFLREELAGVDLKDILSRDAYKSRSGRPPKSDESGHIPPDDAMVSLVAARTLGVHYQGLKRFVRSGVLERHPYSRGVGHYYYRDQVEAYAKRYIRNPDLTAIGEVATRLGRTVASLYKKEVFRGDLQVEMSPVGKAYLRRSQLSELFDEFRRPG